MKLQRTFGCVLVAFLVICLAGNAFADWKEDQTALFQQIPVEPGERVDSSNWEKVKDLLPPSMVEWVKKGDYILNIGEFKWNYNTDAAWRQASASNADKYDIGTNDEIIEKATGNRPSYVYGEPFPNIDWKKDPKAGAKLIYNMDAKGSRPGQLNMGYNLNWIGQDGFEREVYGTWFTYYFWDRPDGQISNPAGYLSAEIVKPRKPYDVSGIVSLSTRSIDGNADQNYTYVPAIRRVKKLSATTRSSPMMGSDFVNDDAYNWYGKSESMKWKIVGQKIILMPVDHWAIKGPAKFTKKPDGSWEKPGNLRGPLNGYEASDWKGAPWAPADCIWVPRMMYIVEATAKDEYYNYGNTVFYVDPLGGFIYKVVKDKAGEYWKTGIVTYVPAEWDNKICISVASWQTMVDEKSHHATNTNCFGTVGNNTMTHIYMDPDVSTALFSPTALPALSK